MSFKKNNPYPYSRDRNGNRNSDIVNERAHSSKHSKREVNPHYSEPEEYRCLVPQNFPSQQQNSAYYKLPNSTNMFSEKSSWGFTPIQKFETNNSLSNTSQLYQPMQSFRQHVNGENEERIQPHSMNSIPLTNQLTNDFMSEQGINKGRTIETMSKPNSITKTLIGTRRRHMIGTVDQVTMWYKLAKNSELELSFEVAGILTNTVNQDGKQLLLIRSESGHTLQGVFYTIDRVLPNFSPGTTVTATGNMIGTNKIHIFDMIQISRDDFIAVQRLAFLSQRALEEML